MMRNSHHPLGLAQQETFGLALLAFDPTFAAGPGNEREPVAYSTLRVESIEPPHELPGARLLAAFPDGPGGYILVVDGAANLGLEWAVRRCAVDFSGRRGRPVVVTIGNALAAATPFVATFQLHRGPGISVARGRAPATPWLLLRRGDAWLTGCSLGHETHEVGDATHARERTARNTAHRLHLVLALGRGEPPSAPPVP